jgi:hypothetical protein
MTSTKTISGLPDKPTITAARNAGRHHATEAADKPLAAVAICQAYFRMVASMALKSANPQDALRELLVIHNQSAEIELREMIEARS